MRLRASRMPLSSWYTTHFFSMLLKNGRVLQRNVMVNVTRSSTARACNGPYTVIKTARQPLAQHVSRLVGLVERLVTVNIRYIGETQPLVYAAVSCAGPEPAL